MTANTHHPQHFRYRKFTVLPNLLYNQVLRRSDQVL
jgi:hypothetical protein